MELIKGNNKMELTKKQIEYQVFLYIAVCKKIN